MYNTLSDFVTAKKLNRLIKTYLDGTYRRSRQANSCTCISHSERSEKRRCFIATAFRLCFKICYQEGSNKRGGTEAECDTTVFDLR